VPATEFLRKFNLRVEPGWVVFLIQSEFAVRIAVIVTFFHESASTRDL
jgi:hypothetical protein